MMSEPTNQNVLTFRVGLLETRVEKLEGYEPAVMAKKIDDMSQGFRDMKNAVYVLLAGIVLAAIGFAFTVLSQKGGH